MTRNDWAHKLLDLLKARHCDHNAWAMIAWMQAEGNSAKWNPLNTTQPMPGATDLNSVGVKNYKTAQDGLAATVKTIVQEDPDLGYDKILLRLKRCAPARRTLEAVEDSDWGTGGLALDCLAQVRADYDRWACIPILGS